MFYLGIHIYTHIYSTKTINEKRYKKFERKWGKVSDKVWKEDKLCKHIAFSEK